MFDFRDAADGFDERRPCLPLLGQHAATFRRDLVIPAPPLGRHTDEVLEELGLDDA